MSRFAELFKKIGWFNQKTILFHRFNFIHPIFILIVQTRCKLVKFGHVLIDFVTTSQSESLELDEDLINIIGFDSIKSD